MKKNIIIIIITLVALLLLGALLRREHFREVTKMVQTDTVYVYDTIRIDKPVQISIKETSDTLILPIRDTIRLRDTVYLVMNRQIKEYRDSLYYARVSGYEPSLDFIEVYPKKMVISKKETTTIGPSNWRFTLDCGLDYGRMGCSYVSPNIGAEVGYKRWSIGAEGGMNLDIANGVVQAPQFYWQIGVRYRILGK